MLARLIASRYDQHFVLKGGALLAAYAPRRPTRDIDLSAQDLENDAHSILALMKQVVDTPQADGLEFDALASRVETIR